MKISGKRSYIFTTESVAMTDVVLNMFIFFFISFSLLYTFDPNRTQNISIKLPRASSAAKTAAVGEATIIVSSEDIIYFKNKPLTLTEVADYFKKEKFSSVIIKADKDASVGVVVSLWDTFKKFGIEKIGIATTYDE